MFAKTKMQDSSIQNHAGILIPVQGFKDLPWSWEIRLVWRVTWYPAFLSYFFQLSKKSLIKPF